MRLSLGDPAGCTSARAQHRKWLCSGLAAVLSMTTLAALAAPASATGTMPWGCSYVFCQLLGELTCRDSGWLSWARFALPVASGVLSRVARFRLRGLVPGRGRRF